jgi:hypothetical protein
MYIVKLLLFTFPGDTIMLWEEDDVQDEVAVIDDYFLDNVDKLTAGYLRDLFQNKEMHCGGPIHPKIFTSKRCLDMALNTPVEKGMEIAYEAIGSPDIKLVLSILKECGMLGIPKCFRPGILLIYLELCHGCRINAAAA